MLQFILGLYLTVMYIKAFFEFTTVQKVEKTEYIQVGD